MSRTAGSEMLDKINCYSSGFPGLESQKVTVSEQDTHLPDVHSPYTASGQLHCHRKSARPRPRRPGRLAVSCPWPQPGLPGWVLLPRAGPQGGSRSLKRCGMAGRQEQRLPWSRADVLGSGPGSSRCSPPTPRPALLTSSRPAPCKWSQETCRYGAKPSALAPPRATSAQQRSVPSTTKETRRAGPQLALPPGNLATGLHLPSKI